MFLAPWVRESSVAERHCIRGWPVLEGHGGAAVGGQPGEREIGRDERSPASGLWVVALVLFVVGWIFSSSAMVGGKPPEFLHDWRFLLVGLRWWVAKLRGRA